MPKLITRFRQFFYEDSTETSELSLAVAKLIVGFTIFFTPFQTHTIGQFSGQGIAVFAGMLCILLGMLKARAWFVNDHAARRLHALVGSMLWIFVGVLESFEPSQWILTMLFFLFAFTDMIVFIRLRLNDGN